MIGYPYTWKGDLQFDLRRTQDYVARARALGTDAAIEDARAWVELFAATAAFKTRRLMEAGHLSDEVARSRVAVQRFPRRKAPPNFVPGRVDDFCKQYDLGAPQDSKVPLKRICNQIIHADLSLDGTDLATGALIGFMVASDTTKVWECYFVRWDDFFSAIRRVCTDGLDWMVPADWRGVQD